MPMGKPQDGGYTTKELAIPVAFTWQQGKKYVYTLVFGNGTAVMTQTPKTPNRKTQNRYLFLSRTK